MNMFGCFNRTCQLVKIKYFVCLVINWIKVKYNKNCIIQIRNQLSFQYLFDFVNVIILQTIICFYHFDDYFSCPSFQPVRRTLRF